MKSQAPAEFEETFTLPARSLRALEDTDNLSPELRQCVHEYGYAIVRAMMSAGIKNPATIRVLVKEIWMGARQPAQRNRLGRSSHSPVLETLDWILIQAGAQIGAKVLLRVLWDNSMVIVPLEPSTTMIQASAATLATFSERVTKTEKHRRRLRAAIEAQARRLWPHLFKLKQSHPTAEGKQHA